MIFWMMPDSAAKTQEVMQGFLAPFKKLNPDIDVQIKVINRRTLWAEIFTLKRRAGREERPDLIAIPHYWTELLTHMGAIVNLTELDKTLRVDNCLDPLKPQSYKKGSADVYSYPWWMDVTALHYREDHLKLICADPAAKLSTWQGMLEACESLKEHFGTTGYYPVQNSDWRGTLSNRSVLPNLWSRGACLMDKEGAQSGFNGKEFTEGLQDYLQLALKNYMPVLKERGSLGVAALGKSSIVMTRRMGAAVLGAQDAPVQTIGVPRTGAKEVNYLGGVSLAVVSGGAQTQAAHKLLKWLISPGAQLKYAALAGVFPAAEASFEQFLLAAPARVKNYTGIIANGMALESLLSTGTVMEVLAALLSDITSDIVMNKYSALVLKERIKTAAAEVDNILNLYGN
ncbi:MAG: extracellular solute-binding protein [Elusimicrobiota bacterium]|jgi:multiple sugar transport system substrate-binding protein|nr:extracellular solute-binding protein [Elusimicrobiota bacterium]